MGERLAIKENQIIERPSLWRRLVKTERPRVIAHFSCNGTIWVSPGGSTTMKLDTPSDFDALAETMPAQHKASIIRAVHQIRDKAHTQKSVAYPKTIGGSVAALAFAIFWLGSALVILAQDNAYYDGNGESQINAEVVSSHREEGMTINGQNQKVAEPAKSKATVTDSEQIKYPFGYDN